ncbi:MAG: glutamate racemase [Planctomycetia bacterium]|nr:MAG: glutamate racemase [Planctomycetia bacterium]
MSTQPIAVFDSGIGGLTVVRHLRSLLPSESLVYFGDTARVPYGSKSQRTVAAFSLDVARFLMQFEPKLMVVACNTASALAMDDLARELPIPVVGVLGPSAAAAARLARDGVIAILATEATIASGAYPAAVQAARRDARVEAIACPLFVPLAEEGRTSDDPAVRLIAEGYLSPLRGTTIDAAVLGCTHYPLLRDAIAAALGPQVAIVDSGREAALSVQQALAALGMLSAHSARGSMRCFVSDNPQRFRRLGARFLNEDVDSVEFVEPERYATPAASALPPA